MKNFAKGCGNNSMYYPVDDEFIMGMEKCALVSVREGHDQGLTIPEWFDVDESTNEIIELRKSLHEDLKPFLRKWWPFQFEFPEDMPGPLEIAGLSYDNPQGLANAVHMDKPLDFAQYCIAWVNSVVDVNSPWKEFVERWPGMELSCAKAVYQKLNLAFQAKYYFGVPRPEEVAGENITAYPEGCPNHPSFPAGHSANAAASALTILVNYPGSWDKIKEDILTAQYLFGMFRSVAGVHHPIDNIAGMAVGGVSSFFREDDTEYGKWLGELKANYKKKYKTPNE